MPAPASSALSVNPRILRVINFLLWLSYAIQLRRGRAGKGLLGVQSEPVARARMGAMKVSVVIEKDENGYYAYSPELEGCQSQGATFEEALANVREAVELYLETLTPEEARERLSTEVVTTSFEVKVA